MEIDAYARDSSRPAFLHEVRPMRPDELALLQRLLAGQQDGLTNRKRNIRRPSDRAFRVLLRWIKQLESFADRSLIDEFTFRCVKAHVDFEIGDDDIIRHSRRMIVELTSGELLAIPLGCTSEEELQEVAREVCQLCMIPGEGTLWKPQSRGDGVFIERYQPGSLPRRWMKAPLLVPFR